MLNKVFTKVIHFNNTTGKNKGKLQLTKLATHLGKTEGALRATKKRSEKELLFLHLGALCEANGISEKDLEEFLKKRGFEANAVRLDLEELYHLVDLLEMENRRYLYDDGSKKLLSKQMKKDAVNYNKVLIEKLKKFIDEL